MEPLGVALEIYGMFSSGRPTKMMMKLAVHKLLSKLKAWVSLKLAL